MKWRTQEATHIFPMHMSINVRSCDFSIAWHIFTVAVVSTAHINPVAISTRSTLFLRWAVASKVAGPSTRITCLVSSEIEESVDLLELLNQDLRGLSHGLYLFLSPLTFFLLSREPRGSPSTTNSEARVHAFFLADMAMSSIATQRARRTSENSHHLKAVSFENLKKVMQSEETLAKSISKKRSWFQNWIVAFFYVTFMRNVLTRVCRFTFRSLTSLGRPSGLVPCCFSWLPSPSVFVQSCHLSPSLFSGCTPLLVW